MSTCKTAKMWNDCEKGTKFDSAAHKLKVMDCFLDELYSEKGLALGGDEYVPQYPQSVIVDCIQEFVMPGLNKLIEQESAPVDTEDVEREVSATDVLINTQRDAVRVLLIEYDEVLDLYRKLSKGGATLAVNGAEVPYESIEAITMMFCEHGMPRLIQEIANNLNKMKNFVVDERNANIDGVEITLPDDGGVPF